MSNDYTEEMVGIRRHLHKRPEEGLSLIHI